MRKITLLALLMLLWSASDARAQPWWLTYTSDCNDGPRNSTPASPIGTLCHSHGTVFRAFTQPYPTKILAHISMTVATPLFVCPAGSAGRPYVVHHSQTTRLELTFAFSGYVEMDAANSQELLKLLKTRNYNNIPGGTVFTPFSPWKCWL